MATPLLEEVDEGAAASRHASRHAMQAAGSHAPVDCMRTMYLATEIGPCGNRTKKWVHRWAPVGDELCMYIHVHSFTCTYTCTGGRLWVMSR